ncbi:uncharacterized protein LOC143883245 [Tasmannia lanceolata]|uniref:uncharacterized protein LOC143883245 n=1 Tax=Tasmannia lanceolata TaxID=3420 RepID=UPI0040642043
MKGLHAYSIVGVLWSVSVCCCFYGVQACLKEEKKALLQLKDSINDYPNNATYSLLEDWVGEDCCQWRGVSCSNSSSRVIEIDLFNARDPSWFGVWYPNATLFAQFKELESLYLVSNRIGGWVMPEGFIQMKNLKILRLGDNMLNQSSQSLSVMEDAKQSQICKLQVEANSSNDCSLVNSIWPDPLTCCLTIASWIGVQRGFLHSLNWFEFIVKRRSRSREDIKKYQIGLCFLKRLTRLDLGYNNLDDQSLASCLGNLSSLQTLDLSGNNLTFTFGAISTGFCGLKRLTYLYLRDNNLHDQSLPSCLGNLSSLQTLDLSENNLTFTSGAISTGLCGLKRLTDLGLTDNNLHDQSLPSCLGNLSSLEYLDLSENSLTFTSGAISTVCNINLILSPFSLCLILTGICKLRNLSRLNLMRNSIEGIHPCMEGMHNLQQLYLSDNHVTGKIPSFIFNNLTKIESIYLSNNQFMGEFSFSSFANLSKLSDVDLSNNVQLEVETQHPHWVPTFQLGSLSLENCNLNKHSTRTIPSFLSSQDNLYDLNLGHNSLKGIIPSWLLYNMSISSLWLMGNLLEGSIPQSTHNTTSSVSFLDISENNLSEPLPTNIGTLFPQLNYFNLSKNILQGRIPSSMGEIERLSILDLSSNNFSGEMPHQLTKNCTQLVYLNISSNRLQGDILPVDANLIRLQYLFASHNNFTGKILSGLLNSPVLMILDMRKNTLSDTIPSWLFSLSKLVSILLGNNLFRGNIPIQLCQLSNLHTLDLSNNSFSGNIPSCLDRIISWKKVDQIQISDLFINYAPFHPRPNGVSYSYTTSFLPRPSTSFTTKGVTYTYEGVPFTLMTGIDLSMNQLEGDIPFQIGDLGELLSLNLSNNRLTGHLPRSFQNLKSLESLDLSHNKLVGRIPYELSQLDSLGVFSVAYNNLSGKIPYEKHLTTFGNDSYEGNPNLCGPPLERNCSLEIPSQPPRDEGNNSRVLENPMIFYSFVAMSFALGFWGVIGFLILNKNWRHKYFRAMDAYIDWSIEKLSEFRSLCGLKRLTQLDLSDNNLHDQSLPSCLGNLSSLQSLDLSENNLTFTFGISTGNNLFRGNIPIQLCQLSNLHIFDLSNNSFSGNIPSCLNNISSWKKTDQIQISDVEFNFTSFHPRPSTSFTTKGITYFYEGLPFSLMTGIDLSMNQLEGDIPFQIGDLGELRSLNFSNNLPTGYLPQSFKNLKSLESLDLSHNKFVGRIPYELSQLDALGAFSVAYNNLSGKIPFENHLITFGNDSYEGSPDLCGPPLERICSLEIPSQPPRDEGKSSRVLDNPVIFYSFVAMSYALGFWGVIGFLILNQNWRHKYFRAMDAYIDWSTEKLSEFWSEMLHALTPDSITKRIFQIKPYETKNPDPGEPKINIEGAGIGGILQHYERMILGLFSIEVMKEQFLGLELSSIFMGVKTVQKWGTPNL